MEELVVEWDLVAVVAGFEWAPIEGSCKDPEYFAYLQLFQPAVV